MADLDKPAELQKDPCPCPGTPDGEALNDALLALAKELESAGLLSGQPNANPLAELDVKASASEPVRWIGSPAEIDQQLAQGPVAQHQPVPAHAGEGATTISDRRSLARQRLTSLICATVDSTNGGILLNLSKGGAAIRVVDSVLHGQHVELAFSLKPNGARVNACGQVAWIDASQHTAGIHFVDLPVASGDLLEAWRCELSSPAHQEIGQPQESIISPNEVEAPETAASSPISDSAESSGEPPASAQSQSRDQSDSAIGGFGERLWNDLNGSRKWILSGMIVGIAAVIIFGIATYSPAAFAVFRSRPGDAKGTLELVRRWLRDEGPPVATGQRPAARPEKSDRHSGTNATSRSRPASTASAGQAEKGEPTQATSAFPEIEVQGANESRLIRNPAVAAVAVPGAAASRQFQVSYEFSGPAPERVVLPAYPQQARQHNIQGTVVVQAKIGADGKLAGVRVLSGDPTLAAAVEPVLKTWRYEEGKPATETRIMVKFTSVNQ